jgi:hypothetical protein
MARCATCLPVFNALMKRAALSAPLSAVLLAQPSGAPVVAILAVLAFMACAGCVSLCGNADPHTYASPDGRMKVVVFTRDCGATTGFSTQASVVPASAPLPDNGGNAYVADNNHASGGDGLALDVRWLTPDSVELSHSSQARVFKAATVVNGIRVVYRVRR